MLTAHFMFGKNQPIKTNVLEAFEWMSALYNFKVIVLSNDHKH
jgi:recombinational DNA repair ATPase RecF